MQDFTQPPTLHKAASESAVYMPLELVNASGEEVEASMAEDASKDAGKEVDKVEEEMKEEVMEES